MRHNTIVKNSAGLGGGAYLATYDNHYPIAQNTVVWGNSGDNLYHRFQGEVQPYVRNCCIQGWTGGGEGNFSLDPLFADFERDDFRLQAYSPCVDAGMAVSGLADDFLGVARGFDAFEFNLGGSDFDIGAFEYTHVPDAGTPPSSPQDLFPPDGSVDAGLEPTLRCSGFADSDIGGYHLATEWQLSSTPDFASLVFDSGIDSYHPLELRVPILLEREATYFWRVRCLSDQRGLSPWATADFFTRETNTLFVPRDFPSIQEAMDTEDNINEIVVSPRTYQENIRFNNRNLVLRSSDPSDPAVVAQTVIDGGRAGSVVTFGGREGPDCVLAGFTITNGEAESGGGVYGKDCSAAILHNHITNNHARGYGGGLGWCDGAIVGNAISGNSADKGGGGLAYCEGRVEQNRIFDNLSDTGGGLYVCSPLRNNWIYRNRGWRRGGGCYHSAFDPRRGLENNTIFGNVAKEGGGVYWYGGKMVNSILWANVATGGGDQFNEPSGGKTWDDIQACVVEGWSERTNGNLSINPRFVDADNDDYHLLPDSPCIDAGTTPSSMMPDIDGESRIISTRFVNLLDSEVDIGADEFSGEPVTGPAPAAPRNLWPVPSTEDTWIMPLLKCGRYQAPTPVDEHLATQWQVSRSALFNSLVFDSGFDFGNLYQIQLPINLGRGQVFFWRVRYISGSRALGDWGTTFAITTTWPHILVPGDYATIQGALNSAPAGAEIRVNEGTYPESIVFPGRDVVLRSRNPNDWEVIKHTVIDGGFRGSTVRFSGSESPACVLEGFTITGGKNDETYLPDAIRGDRTRESIREWTRLGGGIRGDGTHATIRRNWFRDNLVEALVWCFDCDYEIHVNNAYGGGILGCAGLIEGNVISGAKGVDSKVTVRDPFPPGYPWMPPGSVDYWAYGYGAAFYDCSGMMRNNTAYNNEYAVMSSSGRVRNSIFWNDNADPNFQAEAPEYCCIKSYSGQGTGNISSDPRLVDPTNGDFHLLPDSPCIDAGGYVDGVTVDFDGDRRPQYSSWERRGDDSGFDIGADEVPGSLTLPPEAIDHKILGRLRGIDGTDLNGDGILDIADWITYLRDSGTGGVAP